ncbi:flagellar hook-associated protein FlgK [Thiocystis violacea]|uniref:flagellar hook-associated protein FlgK n=1 Tax=Thiocystis violacea TaxID=13725 RepID=UPI001908155A|nr:flagellar hook-associated protein FlgK [Thiocystis violacea]
MGTAVSGLLAYQRALATTSHNISNAATEGYSRQRTLLETQNPYMLGGKYIGQGVQITAIERMQSDLVNNQLRSSTSNNSYATVLAGFAENVDLVLADETTGLEPVLESFFNSLQDVAGDPRSVPNRTVMLNEAETLVERMSQLNRVFDQQRSMVNGQIEVTVDEINQYSKSLADLNNRIVSDYTRGSAPNDLLDRRDQLLSELSEKIDVSVNQQDDGSVSVFIGNGQALVMGATANALVADHLSADRENLRIGLKTSAGNAPIDVTRFMSGGEIGGLLQTREQMLDGPQNEIGLIALNLATQLNAQNRLGLDLNGEQGQDIFTLPPVAVNAKTTNTASESPTVTISNVSELTASDYRLSYDGSNYRMLRLPENAAVALNETVPGSGIFEAEGMTIDTSAMATPPASVPASGDNWLIQPTRFANSGLEVAIKDPAKIAAAGAITAEPYPLNAGEGRIVSARAVDADTLDLSRVVLTFDGTDFTAVAEDGSSTVLVPDYDATTNTMTVALNGWEVEIQGDMVAGDEFVVESNAGNGGDNRNMLAMADIQNLRTVEGKSTIQGSYNNILATVGSQTRQAQISRDSSATLLAAAQAQRESISGVNLDEEAADMLRYQQAYEASAQVIAVASQMFDTIINAVR